MLVLGAAQVPIPRRGLRRQFHHGRSVLVVPPQSGAKVGQFGMDRTVTDLRPVPRGSVVAAHLPIDLVRPKGTEVRLKPRPSPFRAVGAFVSQVCVVDAGNSVAGPALCSLVVS